MPDIMRARLIAAALCAVILSTLSPAEAQPVNAEVLVSDPFEPGWSGLLDGRLSLARGNVELVSVGGGLSGQYQSVYEDEGRGTQPEDDCDELSDAERDAAAALKPLFIRQRAFVRASSQFSRSGAGNIVHQGFVHARWSAMWHRRVGSDVFTQYQYNQFQRLRLRALFGIGARFVLLHERRVQIWGASGYMFEREHINVEAGAPDDARTSAHRWSSYLTVRYATQDAKFIVQNTLFYQPRLNAFADYRLLEELEILAKITDYFSFGTSLGVLHDNRPPTDVKRTDLRLGTTFKVTL